MRANSTVGPFRVSKGNESEWPKVGLNVDLELPPSLSKVHPTATNFLGMIANWNNCIYLFQAIRGPSQTPINDLKEVSIVPGMALRQEVTCKYPLTHFHF